MSNNGMSIDMYKFIEENKDRLQYDLDNGIVITPRNTNGTLCNSTGYLRVKVNNRLLQVHQILSVIYFGKDCIGFQINHKDGDKTNNKKSNLEIVTLLENVKHAYENNLYGKPNPSNKLAVDKLDLEGNYICTYNSINEAIIDVGLKSSSSIKACLRGYAINGRGEKRVAITAKGFKWRISTK